LGRVAGESLSALGTDPTRAETRCAAQTQCVTQTQCAAETCTSYSTSEARLPSSPITPRSRGGSRYAAHAHAGARGGTPAELDRALRPLLPLRLGAVFDLAEPLRQLHDELLELGLEERVADIAVEAFCEEEAVRVP